MAKVILLKDVPNVGQKYDVKNVANGYAANFLFPRKFAEPATSKKIEQVKSLQEKRVVEGKINKDLLEKNFESLKDVSILMSSKANDQGHLFKGIHKEDIIATLKEQAHVDLPADSIDLDQPIKEVGEHSIYVVSDKKKASFKLIVSAESEEKE